VIALSNWRSKDGESVLTQQAEILLRPLGRLIAKFGSLAVLAK
jgi:hypothetical protein